MKKIILIVIGSLHCFSSTTFSETEIGKIQRALEHSDQAEQQEAQKLPNEVVDSLIEHSPELVKKYVQYLKHSVLAGEVKPKTLFLYGPSGVGKTETAIALAIKAKMSYTVINGAELGNEFQNSAKNQLKKVFDPILQSDRPHVMVIDELMRLVENYNDKKGSHEDNSTATAFWHLLDQCIRSKHIFVIATANDIERCPKMVKTRFGSNRFVEFKMPDKQTRKRILKVLMPKGISCSDLLLDQLAKATEDMPPRDYKYIIESAEMNLVCENKGRKHFEFDDFREEIDRCREANKEDGTLTKAFKSAKEKFENDSLGAVANAGVAFGGVATVAEGVGRLAACFGGLFKTKEVAPIVKEGVKRVIVATPEVAKKTVEVSPKIAKYIAEKFGKHAPLVLNMFARR